jgi:hypothetical protein
VDGHRLTCLLGLADVDTATTPASKGCAAVYAANPATATNARQKLLTLNTTTLPIDDLRRFDTSVTIANVTARDRFRSSTNTRRTDANTTADTRRSSKK